MSTFKQVIILRKDLGMNKGKMIAQGAHAASMVIYNNYHAGAHAKDIDKWVDSGMAKIVVGVNSLEELEEVYQKAINAGLLVYKTIDSGKTVPTCKDQITAISIGPNKSEDIDKITEHLKLL